MYKYEKRTLKEYSVICGSCGARAGWALSREEALQLARDNGWHLGSSASCPECYFLSRVRKAAGVWTALPLFVQTAP
jgi:ribosomal protein L37AE/L43A